MRVERKMETPPPPVSPERTENRPAPPRPDASQEAAKAADKKAAEKPTDVGRNLDVTA